MQFTEEKLGRTERTEYDLDFQDLEKKTDLTRSYTEKIKNNTAAVIVPNPGINRCNRVKGKVGIQLYTFSRQSRNNVQRQCPDEQARVEEGANDQPRVFGRRHDRGRE